MSGISRLAIATVLAAGLCGVAQAQSPSRHAPAGLDRYSALYQSNHDVADYGAGPSGTVAPSESHTVMGLRVPR